MEGKWGTDEGVGGWGGGIKWVRDEAEEGDKSVFQSRVLYKLLVISCYDYMFYVYFS